MTQEILLALLSVGSLLLLGYGFRSILQATKVLALTKQFNKIQTKEQYRLPAKRRANVKR